MSQLHIHTPQNVAIQQQLAGVGHRIAATLIDLTTIAAYIYVFAAVLNLIDLDNRVMSVVYMLPVFFYSLLFEYFMEGQTPGKLIMGIQVVKLDGSSPRPGDLFLRWILRILDIWMFSGLVAVIAVMFSRNGQRFGDLAAGTTVVFIRKRPSRQPSIYRNLPENYEPRYRQVIHLEEKDIRTIARVLAQLQTQRSPQNQQLAIKAADAIRKKMHIENRVSPEVFLEKIVQDYNYYLQAGLTEDPLSGQP